MNAEEYRAHVRRVAEGKNEVARLLVEGLRGCSYDSGLFDAEPVAEVCLDSPRAVQVTAVVDGVSVVYEFVVRELRAC